MIDSSVQSDALGWRQKVGWTEGVPSLIQREEIVVELDGGPLDVRGDDYEAALLVSGKIEVFQWNDCEGSVGQNLVRAMSSGGPSSVKEFRESVEKPVADGDSLSHHFSDVLRLLAAGNYVLALEEIPADAYVVDLVAEPQNGFDITGYYPGFGTMIATQPLKELSSVRVNCLAEQIQKGARPTIITMCAEGAWGEFIIDGHHKISAYRQASVPAIRLNIIRRQSERLPIAEILNFLPDTDNLKESLKVNRPA